MRVTRLTTAVLLGLGLTASTLTTLSTASAAPHDRVGQGGDGATDPVVEALGSRWERFYPADDGYRDRMRVSYAVSDSDDATVDVTVSVVDRSGTVLGERLVEDVPTGPEVLLRWDGTDFQGTALGRGRYTLRFTATDAAGTESQPDGIAVTLNEGVLVDREHRAGGNAERSLVGMGTGRCGRLDSDVRRFPGAIGHDASARCDARGRDSRAVTVHALDVPLAYRDRDRGYFYGDVTVTTRGGSRDRRPGSTAVLEYRDQQDDRWVAASRLASPLGSHEARTTSARPLVTHEAGQHLLRWRTRTTNRNWYLVRGFTMVIDYQVMKQPEELTTRR